MLRVLGGIVWGLALWGAPALAAACNASYLPVWQSAKNLADVKAALVDYHDSGAYDCEIRERVDEAFRYVKARTARAKPSEKLAAVFDVDETALSNWKAMAGCGFCDYRSQMALFPIQQNPAQAIAAVLELFNFVKQSGVSPFFITGRGEGARAETVKNLGDAGYAGWSELIMRPQGNTEPAAKLKPARRQELVHRGYTIILSIGDQDSDLAGCCAERTFKLPNPFYFVP